MKRAENRQPRTDLGHLRQIRDEILRIAANRNAMDLRVFGSVAKGESEVTSDVDFLVRMAPHATLVDVIGLEQDLEALLGRKVDVVTDDAISPRMRDEIRASAVKL